MKAKSEKKSGRYVVVRGDRSGVFAGTLMSRRGREVVLTGCRRIWYWSGAASISELAQRGTSNPGACKFPAPVDRQEVLDVIEVIDCSGVARASIEAVKPWTQ